MSMFLSEKGALFLHIARTGGRYIQEGIVRSGIPNEVWKRAGPSTWYRMRYHAPLYHIDMKWLVKVKYVFAFVRNPFDYYVSVWRYLTRGVTKHSREQTIARFKSNPTFLLSEATRHWKPDFNEWLEEMLEEEPGWVTRWFERYVGPPYGGEICHYIGRLETLNRDMQQVMDLLGYGDKWKLFQSSLSEKAKQRRRLKYKVGPQQAPLIVLSEEQKKKIARSERVMLQRFYGTTTCHKRFYREIDGFPIWPVEGECITPEIDMVSLQWEKVR